ncbi:hypothetical protein G6731_01500 [Polynucleobacter paneuropaeus]|uniref:Type I restriction modification DNA specificity domain-containing protein n=1 Tax=Polynucleobacter paneuropaeus TaxID=2527775 RepID=A0A9Q2WFU5_9BURK|nr:hypothetical protein [Polynucleobacter paneuropaeus]
MSNLSSLISKVVGGGTPSRAVDSYWGGVIPWASVKDISGSQRYLTDTEEHISSEGLKSSSCTLIPAGVPIIATRMAVGAVTIPAIPTGINQDLKGLFLNPDVDPIFARYLILHLQEKISSVSVGSTVKGINVQDLLKIQIPEPPDLQSQQKIAQILTAIDEQIDATEKLIEKKKSLHTGIEHDLLVKNAKNFFYLDELGATYGGLNGKSKEDFGVGEYFITYMQVFGNRTSNSSLFEKVAIYENEFQNKVRYGDILFTISSETYNELAMASVFLDKSIGPYLNSFCFGYRLNDFQILMPEFASHFFRSDFFRKKIIPLAQGSTRYNTSKGALMKLQIHIPPIDKQKEIAEILNSGRRQIDAELKLLDKLKLQKQGLMQDLLTGRVRVN